MEPISFDRRRLMAAALGWAALLNLPAAQAAELMTPSQSRWLRDVVDAVIPRTDTPGASDVGVHQFLVIGLEHGLEGSRDPSLPGPKGRDHLDWLAAQLERTGEKDIARAVTIIDQAAFAAGPASPPTPWVRIKSLILLGYYMSEAGATRELRYELVPGRWDPDVPVSGDNRAWSSDWTALTFG